MHNFLGLNRNRYHNHLGVVPYAHHAFVGTKPMTASGTGKASAPHIGTGFNFHNDGDKDGTRYMDTKGLREQQKTAGQWFKEKAGPRRVV